MQLQDMNTLHWDQLQLCCAPQLAQRMQHLSFIKSFSSINCSHYPALFQLATPCLPDWGGFEIIDIGWIAANFKEKKHQNAEAQQQVSSSNENKPDRKMATFARASWTHGRKAPGFLGPYALMI